MKFKKAYISLLLYSVSYCALAQTNNSELQKMYEADQNSRAQNNISWEQLNKEDKERENRVYELINEGKIITAKDYYNSAMIFQHGNDTIASSMAVKHMKKAIELDPGIDKWLLAAAIDRDLMRRKKPQIYGTQFIKNESTNGRFVLYEMDTTKISDEERREHNVETLAELKIKEQQMNANTFNQLIEGKEFKDAFEIIKKEYSNKGKSSYNLNFEDLLLYTNNFFKEKKYDEASRLAKLCTELYPYESSAFAIYGFILLAQKHKEEAIKVLEYSLKLNPSDQTISEILKDIKE